MRFRNLFFALLLLVSPPVLAQQMYATPDEAQRHCPHDTVVWLNIPTGVYHYPGTRWYGATKSGAFVCEREASSAGDRPARNNQ